LIWSGLNIPAQSEVNVTVAAVVGSGAQVGEYVNIAYVDSGITDVVLSNLAEATVRVTPDEIFDCSEVIGKVFDDVNRNGIQEDGEEGIGGVRLATVNGLLVTTDEYGRYHIACAATPKVGIGSNFILKLDDRTLPGGYVVTTENPRVIRLTQGKMSQLDFGIGMLRPVEFQLEDKAFVAGSTELTEAARAQVDTLVNVLEQQSSVLTLIYMGSDMAEERLEQTKDIIADLWEEADSDYELIIETEVVSSRQNP